MMLTHMVYDVSLGVVIFTRCAGEFQSIMLHMIVVRHFRSGEKIILDVICKQQTRFHLLLSGSGDKIYDY